MSFVSSALSTWASTAESFLPSPTTWIDHSIQARNNEPSFSSFPTAWEIEKSLLARDAKSSPPTPSASQGGHPDQTQDANPTLATQVALGVPADICTSYLISVQKNMSVPTGIVRFTAAGTGGWGDMGTIWNIATGGGAKLIDMKAACQGSGCTGINGEYNKENDGKMTQRTDGSWDLEVTRDMKKSLMISGQLVADKATNSRRKYPLNVSAHPKCGLQLAKNCTDSAFFTDKEQWPAYQMDKHIEEYIHGSSSIDEFGERILGDTMSSSEKRNQLCKIDSPHLTCSLPTIRDCVTDASTEHARQLMMRASYVGFANFMAMVYQAVGDVAQTIGTEIASVVTHIWKKVTESNWTKVAALVSSIIGVVIVAAVIAQFFAPGTGSLAVAALVGVAGTILGSNVAGLSGNAGNLDSHPAAPDTQTKKATQYTLEAYEQLNKTQIALRDSMKNRDIGSDGIADLFRGGSWASTDFQELLKDGGIQRNVTSWHKRSIVGEYTTRSLVDYDWHILFIEFGDDIKWARKKIGFSKEDCELRFINNKNWKYTAFCDVSYRPGGKPGMAVLTRPRIANQKVESTETEQLFDGEVRNGEHEITAKDITTSSLHGQYLSGFGFALSDKDYAKEVSTNGVEAMQKKIMDRDPAEPGLYSLPACQISNLVYLPQADLVMSDWKKLGRDWAPEAKGPCSCADYEFTPEGGEKGKFRDHVGQKIKDSIYECSVYLGAQGTQKDKGMWKYGDGEL